MKFKKSVAAALSLLMSVCALGCSESGAGSVEPDDKATLALEYTFDESGGSTAKETVSGKDHKIN